jgi:Gram-negative bacterial TonB protein C-terminal
MKYDLRKVLFLGVFIIINILFSGSDASAQLAAIAAIDEPEAAAEAGGVRAGGGDGKQGSSSKSGPKSGGAGQKSSTGKKPKVTSKKVTKTTPAPPPPPAKFNGPVLGDKYSFLNGEVISAEKPYYTRAAKATGAKGLVQVEILVSTDGSVLSAKARTGNKELWSEAERAALASKLNRPMADGRPARALGFLVYRFGPAED